MKGCDALEIVASEFGGLFTYTELLNFDVRDLAFWADAARRKILMDQVRSIQAVRIGMAEDEAYQDRMNDIMAQLQGQTQETIARKSWEELRRRGRG